MFERSLSSLIKGLRSHRGKDEARYVATLMDEIKMEVRSGDMEIKAEAILKLTYLQMLGYAPSNASFHMLEVMASPRFHLKHVGYLAASQTFTQDTDVLILATNMVKKDLRSSSSLDIAVALNGLSHILTPDLAQHLSSDVITLLTHTKPVIRKRALLVLHSIILQYPPALEQALPKIAERLDDPDNGVVSATVNIVCELARRDEKIAKAFLPLSPQLFHLLTNSTNNWMLIKIVKLFGVLTPLEPRLAKKLLPPITTLITTTPAMSLLYECMHTVIIGGMLEGTGGDELAATCSEKLGVFLEDDDQNLRYIALLALVKILPTHPHLVAVHQDSIFESMDDEDLSIRFRALDLVSGMASRENFVDIVEQQLRYLDPSKTVPKPPSAAQALRQAMQANGAVANAPSTSWITASYRLEIINRILDLGSQDTYTNIVDFEWYVDVLVRLQQLAGNAVGFRIQEQLIDISARVRAIRPHAIYKLKQVIEDFNFIDGRSGESGQELLILRAAAWICGEYCQHVAYPPAIISLLLRSETLKVCDGVTRAMVVHNAIKLFAWWLLEQGRQWTEDKLKDVQTVTNEVASSIESTLAIANDIELEERLSEFNVLVNILQGDLQNRTQVGTEKDSQKDVQQDAAKESPSAPKSLQLLSPLFFGHALGPVAKKAQSKVAVPSGLDLDTWFVEPAGIRIIDEWEAEEAAKKAEAKAAGGKTKRKGSESEKTADSQERRKLKAERLKRQSESPFYLGSKPGQTKAQPANLIDDQGDDIDSIPIVQLQLDEKVNEAKTPPIIPQQEEEEMPDAAEVENVAVRKAVSKKKKRSKGVSEATLQ
ncbi:Adaptor protein complex AP-3 delta subunit [Meira miltonrushii]|uniref:Adaptor protein complex AP-3 delta subunit n=1 Tax=Meira miltonrushii TaxID=1280837 RepID=A0A316V426_9BASI|nr:Adaptor protein complex AP-3 delta subunit [Meira miltonrushii]PWN32309.1 Adaptor protein complex AP-3 delta subunit [Meira miltonrushii]